jgi:hypothetical protein
MNRSGMMVTVSLFLSVMWVHAQKTNATVPKSENASRGLLQKRRNSTTHLSGVGR